MFKMQPGSLYQSSFRSYCSCPHPSCVEDRNSGHVCQAPLSCQKSSESHLRLQGSSLLQIQGDAGGYSKADRSAFVPSAFGIISRPSRFFVPSTHCSLSSQQLFFPFSQTSPSRQHGKSICLLNHTFYRLRILHVPFSLLQLLLLLLLLLWSFRCTM